MARQQAFDEGSGKLPEFQFKHDWETIEPHLNGEPDEHAFGFGHLAAGGDERKSESIDPWGMKFAAARVGLHHLPDTTVRHGDRVRSAMEGYRDNPEGMPPVTLVHTGEALEVEDGHHRIAAARRLGMKKIPAIIADGRGY
jgi:hypothetical protein